MSLISQLFRQLTSIDCPPDIERELIDYIKTFNGNVKIHRLLNIFSNTVADDVYVKCMKMKLPELKQYSKLYDNNRFQVSSFSTSGSTGGVVKVDYAYACAYTEICNYAEEKLDILKNEIMFNQLRYYDSQQDKVISRVEKQDIIMQCISPLLQSKISEITKSYDRYKNLWKKHKIVVGRGSDGDVKQSVMDMYDKKLEYWNRNSATVETLVSRLQKDHLEQMKVLRSRFKMLTLNRVRHADILNHSYIPSLSHYHKSTAKPICYFEYNVIKDYEVWERRSGCKIRSCSMMTDLLDFNYPSSHTIRRNQYYWD
tara:strand:+ start:637 stop:1575 length:939 start_codon:yes stop_codon:yes gene_type:complete